MLKVVENTLRDAEQSVGAETILRVYGPMIERRIESLVRSIIAAPEAQLPELRGRLAEVWNSLSELRQLAEKKQSVDKTFNNLFAPFQDTAN